jgi:hypothetical protein
MLTFSTFSYYYRSDDYECKQQVSAAADLLKNLSTQRGTPRTQSQKPHLAGTPKLTAKQTEANSRQRDGKF